MTLEVFLSHLAALKDKYKWRATPAPDFYFDNAIRAEGVENCWWLFCPITAVCREVTGQTIKQCSQFHAAAVALDLHDELRDIIVDAADNTLRNDPRRIAVRQLMLIVLGIS